MDICIVSHLLQVRRYKNDYEEAKRRFAKCEDKYLHQKNRETLMGASIDEGKQNDRHREALLATGQLIQSQNDRLDDARRVGLEVDNIASDIKLNLHSQGKQLERAHENVSDGCD